jgi:ribonuclease HI
MSNKISAAYFDGACSGNPGPMAIKWVVLDQDGNEIDRTVLDAGSGTNNQAEHMSLLSLLKYLDSSGNVDDQVIIHGDSQLVTNQVKGAWKINEKQLRVLAEKSREILARHPKWSLVWIPRETNIAD